MTSVARMDGCQMSSRPNENVITVASQCSDVEPQAERAERRLSGCSARERNNDFIGPGTPKRLLHRPAHPNQVLTPAFCDARLTAEHAQRRTSSAVAW